MHEFTLAQNLLAQLLELADQHQARKIIRVVIHLGESSNIVADSFQFGFDVLSKENAICNCAELVLQPTAGSDLILARVEME
ncbi:MAG: hydrogenase/urease maturation nickel metallochaperone HypA [Desulfobulbaceae bacterium]|nr:hydrogenase/urease maturation nickel metallochaperone HypA [Desulfobulbaceae bacterium]